MYIPLRLQLSDAMAEVISHAAAVLVRRRLALAFPFNACSSSARTSPPMLPASPTEARVSPAGSAAGGGGGGGGGGAANH